MGTPELAFAGPLYEVKLFKDINAGAADSEIIALTPFQGKLYFGATDDAHGGSLWVTDGTTAGTQYVATTGRAFDLTVLGNSLLFSGDSAAGRELWMSDGAAGGTSLLKDILPGSGGSSPGFLTAGNNLVYFIAKDTVVPNGLWATDGTEAGTKRISDVDFTKSNSGIPFPFEGGVLISDGYELYNVTPNGPTDFSTTQLTPDGFQNRQVYSPMQLGAEVVFNSKIATEPFKLWHTDGTPEGTEVFFDFASLPSNVQYDGVYLFQDSAILRADTAELGKELWRTDLPSGETTLIADLKEGQDGSYPSQFKVAGDQLYFTANNSNVDPSAQLWRTDGTTQGTELVASFLSETGKNYYVSNYAVLDDLIAVVVTEDELVLDPGPRGGRHLATFSELWLSDGTPDGTVKVFETGLDGAPIRLLPVGDTLWLATASQADGAGVELYRLTTVPEPNALALVSLGFLALCKHRAGRIA